MGAWSAPLRDEPGDLAQERGALTRRCLPEPVREPEAADGQVAEDEGIRLHRARLTAMRP